MERDDLCGFCLRPECPGGACSGRERADVRMMIADMMTAQTTAEVRAVESTVTLCGFCYGAGGYRVECHGCGVIGPITKGTP